MEKETKELIKLTSLEILSTVSDVVVGLFSAFDKGRVYRKPVKEYFKSREIDRIDFSRKIYDLRKRGLIRVVIENKDKYLELTDKGEKMLNWAMIKIDRPAGWDGLFRIVIFDVPESQRYTRDIIRNKLYEIGFKQLQKSVFIYPFECKNEIDAISFYCSSADYLKYMVAEIIQGEEEIVYYFLESGVLTHNDLKNLLKFQRSRKK